VIVVVDTSAIVVIAFGKPERALFSYAAAELWYSKALIKSTWPVLCGEHQGIPASVGRMSAAQSAYASQLQTKAIPSSRGRSLAGPDHVPPRTTLANPRCVSAFRYAPPLYSVCNGLTSKNRT
jgi:hypothetical protein